jgi:hypothetical protein
VALEPGELVSLDAAGGAVRARLVAVAPSPSIDAMARHIAAGWDADTAWIDDWDETNPARGQCGSSALVLQDLLGGTVVRAMVEPTPRHRIVHYWNVLPLGQVDLTWHQFESEARITDAGPVERGELLDGPWFERRYRTLHRRVVASLLRPASPVAVTEGLDRPGEVTGRRVYG